MFATPDPTAPDTRDVSLPLPRLVWIGAATAVLVVSAIGLKVGLPNYRNYAAIREIERLGGMLEVRVGSSERVRNLVRAEFIVRSFDEAYKVSLWDQPATDETLAHVGKLIGVEQLSLGGTKVTDAGLLHLQRLTRLESLILDNTRVTDAGLLHLQALTGLRELRVKRTLVTETGAEELKLALPRIKVTGNDFLIE